MASESPPPVKRSEIFGWCCFDFANSSFTTIIITVVYATYFSKVIAGDHPGASSWWGRALALSQVVVILFAPWLGAVADFTAAKKRFLMASAVVCATATACLFFTGPGDVLLALALVVTANIAFAMGDNFCASFLPEISAAGECGSHFGLRLELRLHGRHAEPGTGAFHHPGTAGLCTLDISDDGPVFSARQPADPDLAA